MPCKKNEKRKTERLRLSLEAICQSQGKFFKGYVNDLSPGGLNLESQKDLQDGEKITLTIDACGIPLKLSGLVRWKRREKLHFLYGIKFDDLSADQEARVREIIQQIFWKNYGG